MQAIITLSSCEAEYIALCEAVKQALWFRRLLSQIGFKQTKPVRVYVDNQGAIDLAKNRKVNMRTKHIDLRFHWVREQVEAKQVQLIHVPGTDNIADMLTKVLGPQALAHLLQNIMEIKRAE